MQGLSTQEIGSAMDLSVGVMNVLSVVAQVDYSVLIKLVAMPPLKIIQSVVAHILFPSINGIDLDMFLSACTGVINKLSLT